MGQEYSKLSNENDKQKRADAEEIKNQIQKQLSKNEKKEKESIQNGNESEACTQTQAAQETTQTNTITTNVFTSSARNVSGKHLLCIDAKPEFKNSILDRESNKGELAREAYNDALYGEAKESALDGEAKLGALDGEKTDTRGDADFKMHTSVLDGKQNHEYVDLHRPKSIFHVTCDVRNSVNIEHILNDKLSSQPSANEDKNWELVKEKNDCSEISKSNDVKTEVMKHCVASSLEVKKMDTCMTKDGLKHASKTPNIASKDVLSKDKKHEVLQSKNRKIKFDLTDRKKLILLEIPSFKCSFSLDHLNYLLQKLNCKFPEEFLKFFRQTPRNYHFYDYSYSDVYAVAFRGHPTLLRSLGHQWIIDYILRTPRLRRKCVASEDFRLATFGLSADTFELGETLGLSARGYFLDTDGRVKCFSCGHVYTHRHCYYHFSNCRLLISFGNTVRFDAGFPEMSAVPHQPSEYDEEEVQRNVVNYSIRIRVQINRFGYEQQFMQEAPYEEETISVRNASHYVSETCDHYPNMADPLTGQIEASAAPQCPADETNVRRQLHEDQDENIGNSSFANEGNSASYRTPSCHVGGSDTSQMKGIQPSTEEVNDKTRGGRRTIKEDVNRETVPSLRRENQRLRSNIQWCLICRERHCNVVLLPCGHLVVCDQCIVKTTICPACEKTVDEAHVIDD